MRKRLKKIIIIGIISVLTLGVIIGALHIFLNEDSGTELTSAEKDIKIITETYPTQIVVYGDEIDFDSSIKVKYIDSINEESLERDLQYKYSLIIVNDLARNVTLTDEEWGLLSNIVKSDNTYNMFYLGDEDIDQLLRVGVFSGLDMWNEGDLSLGLTHEGEDVITVFGTYYKDAGFSLAEVIIAEQVFSIKASN